MNTMLCIFAFSLLFILCVLAYIRIEEKKAERKFKQSQWKPFHWDNGYFWLYVSTREQWKELTKAESPNYDLKAARNNPRFKGPYPSFGFRTEHVGSTTLKEYADTNGFEL